MFRAHFDESAVFRIGIAKRFELAADAAVRCRHAAGHLHTVVEEKFLHALQQRVVSQVFVPLNFDINLVHFQLPAEARPILFEFFRLLKTLDHAHRDVNRHGKIGVLPGMHISCQQDQTPQGNEKRPVKAMEWN